MRVLVATGEKHIARLLQVNLERHDHEVLKSADGTKCLFEAINESPDLIVLDAKLPPLGGLRVFHALRENEQAREIEVVVLGEKDGDWPDAGQGGPSRFFAQPKELSDLFQLSDA